jgi:DNA-binding response OmpR family regulator
MVTPLKGNVLIIDDEPNLRHTLARLLQSVGCHVTAVADGAEALQTLENNVFDIVFLDIHLPGLNGLQVLREIRSENSQLPVILLSGQATLQSALEAIRLGATDFLLKPVDPEVLIARTRILLEEQAIEKRRKEIEDQIAVLQAELQSLKKQEDPTSPALSSSLSVPETRFIKRGSLILDLQARRGTLGDKILSIPPTAFDYLVALIQHAPEVVDYETLVSEAQGYTNTTR